MSRSRKYRQEGIIPQLREAEVMISQGMTQELAAKRFNASDQTLIRPWKQNGGLQMYPQSQRNLAKSAMCVPPHGY